jgi:predicted nucleic acid-binding protein
MDNMGGLLKLYYVDGDDFVSLEPGEDDLLLLTLAGGAVINEIEFTAETGKISEVSDETDNGTVYNFEVSCRIAKCGPANTNLMGELRLKRIIILAQDDNDNFWLAGAPGSYFKIITTSDTGVLTSDFNSRQLKISASLVTESVFIESPF